MQTEIQIFKNEQFGEIRTMLDEKGQPWFVGKDVAEKLGYKKSRNALMAHVDGEAKKGALTQGSLVVLQTKTIANERGAHFEHSFTQSHFVTSSHFAEC